MVIFRVFIFIAVVFISFNSKAQTSLKSFTPDSVRFIQELTTFFEEADKKAGRDFIRGFMIDFYSGKFSDEDRNLIYTTSNIMLKKRMKPFPDFQYFLSTMGYFANGGHNKSTYDSWKVSLDQVIKKSTTRKFEYFIEISYLLFTENIMFKSSTISWSSNNNNFSFEYDSVPYIVFDELNLKCESKGDSSVIYNTSGICYPTEGKWIGSGGTVNWIRTGIDDKTVVAELSDYQITMKTPFFTADSVTFYNTKYFDQPLLGRLQEKILANVTERNASYPRFESYHKRFKIKDIIPGVDYDGGFSMIGPKFIGSGTEEEQALLTFYRDKKPFLIASSEVFVIRKERISSEKAAIKMYLENDSITHPGLQFKLLSGERILTLFRDGKGISQSPFYNSFHKVDMDFEALSWSIDKPFIEMEAMIGSTRTEARLESSNFYSPYQYEKLFAMSPEHILVVLKDIAKKFNSKVLLADDIARYMRFTMNDIAPMMLILSNMGYVSYNTTTNQVTLKDKLYFYIDSNAKRKDYDVIEFNSNIKGKANATLNLDDNNLTLRGVPVIHLSDSQNVYIRPSGQTIVLKKNRDFDFGGSVHAGLFDLYGKEFAFDYETFKINLIKVDSLSIRVKTQDVDDEGNRKMVRVKTVIEDVQGDLLIDAPNNKSGIKDFPTYPVINSRKESFVYYDRSYIQKGAYSRDKVYFKLEPFTFDSINNFRNEALSFKGLFVSGGIFPDFEENLSLQKDYSLGFIRKAPPGGYPLYGGKADFHNDIKLSNEGLKGDGTLKYLTSTTWSDNFIFFPDSTNARAQKHELAEKAGDPEFPSAVGEDVYMHYMPYKDVMRIDKKTKPIVMFNNQAESMGSLFLRPSGLGGKGLMNFASAEMESRNYKYKLNEFFTDTCDFRLKSESAAELAFKTTNVNSHVNFNDRSAKFKPNDGGSFVEFPINQYICYVDEFTWFMDKEEIALSSSESSSGSDPTNTGIDLKGSEFISLHPKQDSLSFFSSAAVYSLRENIIFAKGVKYMNIADARLYPDSGLVTVEKRAKMRTLQNATIIASSVNQYHSVYEATIDVHGRKSYTGKGTYDYMDETFNKQQITLNSISVDTTGQTIADGTIPESMSFTLSPQYDFKGKVKLESGIRFLTFDGVCRINHYCDPVPRNWMKFTAEINPIEIYIPISEEPLDVNNDKMAAGIMLSSDSVGIYSAFLSKKVKYSDASVLTASGFLHYDKTSQEFRISNKEKLNELALPGNYVSLNSKDCILGGEGKMDFGVDLGQVKLQPIGVGNQNLFNKLSSFEMIMPVDFFFEDKALDKMADLFEKELGSEPIDYTQTVFEKGIRELMGKNEGDKVISNLGLYGSLKKMPEEMVHTFMLTNIKLNWSNETNSYRSEGKIGVSSILKKQVNKQVVGYVEIVKKRGGDKFHLYLELEGGAWYYFEYAKNLMSAVSSDAEFNKIITDLKADKRKYKNQKGEASYRFGPSTIAKKEAFKRRMETSGGDGENTED